MTNLLRGLALALPLTLAAPAGAVEPPANAKAPAPAKPAAPAAKPGGAKPAAKPTAAADWKEFLAVDAGFAAKFPGVPARDESAAGAMSLVAYAVEREPPAPTFMVMVMSAPPEGGDLPAEMLDQVTAGIVEKLGKNVTKNVPAKAAGRPARELAASGEEGSVAVRLVVVGRRLYQLMALTKHGALPDRDVATFFDSFRMLP